MALAAEQHCKDTGRNRNVGNGQTVLDRFNYESLTVRRLLKEPPSGSHYELRRLWSRAYSVE